MAKKQRSQLGLWTLGDRLDIASGGETRNSVTLFGTQSDCQPFTAIDPIAPQAFRNRKQIHETTAKAQVLAQEGRANQIDIRDEFIGPDRNIFGNLHAAEKKSWAGHSQVRLDPSSGYLH